MRNEIHKLIAAINPDVFCDRSAKRGVKRVFQTAKEQGDSSDFVSAAGKAIPVEPNRIAIEQLELENPFRLPGFKSPTEQHTLSYDSFDESLEAFYFWLLDELSAAGWTVNKLADTFAASAASGLFSDMSRRESQAQHEAMKMLREAHALVRDILRAATFAKETKSSETNANGDKPNNQIDRSLLKSQIESLKLYARWLGPYLRQARQTKQSDIGGPALLNLFNTATAEVTLLAQKEYPVAEDVDRGALPKMFLKSKARALYSVLVIELRLRAAPERASPGAYVYRGRFDLTFTSYSLNWDELAVLRQELDRNDLDEVINSLGEASAKTLNDLVREIDSLVTEPRQSEAQKDDINPFTALFAFGSTMEDRNENSAADNAFIRKLRPDSEMEEVIRSQAILEARRRCAEFYNRCKQTLRMPTF